MANQAKRDLGIDLWLTARGLVRLPECSYGPHVQYVMVPVVGLKGRVRVCVTAESWDAARAARVAS